MLTEEIVLVIPGHPKPKGSMKCVGSRGKRKHVLVESVRNTAWREKVTRWASISPGVAEPGQALGASVTFTLPRPASHYGTGRNAGILKPNAPAYPTGRGTGDVDKLLRLILDALQDAKVIPDDAAIVEVSARKYYAHTAPGVRIRLYPLGG